MIKINHTEKINLVRIVIGILLILLTENSFCQTGIIDSLKNGLEHISETELKVDYLNELAWEYRKVDISFGLSFANQALVISDSIGYHTGYITALNRKGVLLLDQGEYRKSLDIYNKILLLETNQNNQYGIARAQNQLGIIYKKQKQFQTSIEYYKKSLHTFKTINRPLIAAKIVNNIGNIFKEIGLADSAMYYYTTSLEIREKQNDKKGIASCLLNLGILNNSLNNYSQAIKDLNRCATISLSNKKLLSKVYSNLGVSYSNLNQLDKALSFYLKSAQIKETIGLKNELFLLYHNMAIIFDKQGRFTKAIQYFKKSETAQNNKTPQVNAQINNNLGNVYFKQNNIELAIAYYTKALSSSKLTGRNTTYLEILRNIALAHTKNKNFELASKYNDQYILLQDSLESSYKSAIQIKADYEEEKNKNIILQKNELINQTSLAKISAENKRKSVMLYSSFVALLFCLIIFFLILKSKRQQQEIAIALKNEEIQSQKVEEILKTQELKSINDMLNAQESERKRIAQDLHDRLGSMLSMVKIHFNFVEENLESLLEKNVEQYKKANNLLDEACEEVRKIAHNMSSGVLAKFGLVPALSELVDTLTKKTKLEVEFIDFGLDNRLNNDLEINLYRIIQELISNVLKHSFASEISLQVIKNKTHINVIFEDNGVGFNPQEKVKGIGLMNISSRISKFGGHLEIDSGKGNGTTTTIKIPI